MTVEPDLIGWTDTVNLTGSYSHNTDTTPPNWRIECPDCESDNVCVLDPKHNDGLRCWFCISCRAVWEYVPVKEMK